MTGYCDECGHTICIEDCPSKASRAPVVHFVSFWRIRWIACNRELDVDCLATSCDPKKTTCKNCKRTKVWREAQK